MQFEIERIPADTLSVREFVSRYYNCERPVVLTGLQAPFYKDVESTIWSMAHQDDAERRNGHFAVPMPADDSLMRVPALVRKVFARPDIVCKPKPLKLWMQPRGHRTLLHYDGNSLHGLNWQVAGRKHWLLISPRTPPRMLPFTWVAMVNKDFAPDPGRHEHCEFETTPGDMLFLPRYWSHRVLCLGECNANVDWVWTPDRPNLVTGPGRRECAVLKLRSIFGRLDALVRYRVSVDNYADGGARLFNNYANAVGTGQLVTTLIRETGNLALLPFFARSLDEQMQRLAENNFPSRWCDQHDKAQFGSRIQRTT